MNVQIVNVIRYEKWVLPKYKNTRTVPYLNKHLFVHFKSNKDYYTRGVFNGFQTRKQQIKGPTVGTGETFHKTLHSTY